MIRFVSQATTAAARIRHDRPVRTPPTGTTRSDTRTTVPVTKTVTDNFAQIFGGQWQPAATAPAPAAAANSPTASAQQAPPTAQAVFGPNPWVAQPTATLPTGASYSLNELYFASDETAQKLAQMLGGTVVKKNDLLDAGGFVQNSANNMIQLSNGRLINAGLVASFYTHGYPQWYIDRLIANEVNPTVAA